ncbi:MAG: DoxX family membrane protein [Candidatus Eremiobacteraeota bacterium]|nr:DoxX family membrane protein [Candidatus Eremiobacteraeota bacterium]
MSIRSAAVAAIRIILGILLIVAGALKVGHSVELAATIAAFRLLPAEAIAPIALALPFVEIFVGLYLVIGLLTRWAALFAALQFGLYGIAVASAILRGISADCGCFGPNDRATADWPHVAFDFGLALCAALVARFAPGSLALDRRISS